MSITCPICQQREMKHGHFECTMCERAAQDRISRSNYSSSGNHQRATMSKREEIASRVLAGLCANPRAHELNEKAMRGDELYDAEPYWVTAINVTDSFLRALEESS